MSGATVADALARHLVSVACEQRLAGSADWRRVVFDGGIAGACTAIGVGADERENLRCVLDAGTLWRAKVGRARFSGLWTWSEWRTGDDRTGRICVVVGDPLLLGCTINREAGS